MRFSLEGRPPESDAYRVLHLAMDLGVTLFDTADSYCLDETEKHHNERLLRKALDTYQGDTRHILIATKGGCMRPAGKWQINGNPDYLRRVIRESHAALGGKDPIPLWQHHHIDPDYSIEASLAPVQEAVREGLIRFVGLSNYDLEGIKRARDIVDIVSIQNQYNPWHRWPEHNGVLEYCEKEGLTFLPWSPLGGGGRARHLSRHPGLASMAREKGVSPQRLVIAWLMARSPCVLPIPSSSRLTNTMNLLSGAEIEFSEMDIRHFDQLTLGTRG